MEINNSMYIDCWKLSADEKKRYIDKLADMLPALRGTLKISQEELAATIGISRQTYSAIEIKKRDMSWNTYLSLIFFFSCNNTTKEILKIENAFQFDAIKNFNSERINGNDLELNLDFKQIIDELDEQALNSIKALIMIEYSRCSGLPSDNVIKLFEGFSLTNSKNDKDIKIKNALDRVKNNESSN